MLDYTEKYSKFTHEELVSAAAKLLATKAGADAPEYRYLDGILKMKTDEATQLRRIQQGKR